MGNDNENVATLDEGSAVAAMDSQPPALGEDISQLVATAKKYPRSVKAAMDRALTIATLSPEIAAECFYTIPRSGKTIQGPSVRTAEIVASQWGNFRFGSRVLEAEDKTVIAQGFAHDLETNVFVAIEQKRRITSSSGTRFNDDMIVMTGNAAAAIARRNAIFSVIPKALCQDVYKKAKACAIGDAKTLGDRINTCLEAYAKLNVGEAAILKKMKRTHKEDLTLEDLGTLQGIFNAITGEDPQTTIDEQFPIETTTPTGEAKDLFSGDGEGKEQKKPSGGKGKKRTAKTEEE